MIKYIFILIVSLGICTKVMAQQATNCQQDFLHFDRYQTFIQETLDSSDLKKAYIIESLGKGCYQQSIIDRISKPAEAMPWHKYRPIFMQQSRIDAGVKFWNQHKKLFDKVHSKFGVPPEYIVAILGVETRFGKYQGKDRVIDALVTLGFYYPKRAEFFLSELQHYLKLAKTQKFNIAKPKGSYAGAMGMAQFISSSYRNYAIDFDNDGVVDLWNSVDDAVGSIANYFVKHGWQPQQPVAMKIASSLASNYKPYLTDHGEAIYSTIELSDATGLSLSSIPKNASIMSFENTDNMEYWLSYNNFYTITRYNHSRLYGLATHQLANAIRLKQR